MGYDAKDSNIVKLKGITGRTVYIDTTIDEITPDTGEGYLRLAGLSELFDGIFPIKQPVLQKSILDEEE